jgi:hypothetical protein
MTKRCQFVKYLSIGKIYGILVMNIDYEENQEISNQRYNDIVI